MKTRIVARAPTRIDFGGGWTDVPPYSDIEGGYVCNVAIARYATVDVTAATADATPAVATLAETAMRRAGISGVAVHLRSDFPVGAGLGGSSAAGVALAGALAAWREEPVAPSEIAERSRAIEVEDLGIAGGRQDHYAAAHGGALGLTFAKSGVRVERLPLPSPLRSAIERRCIVAYTGESRISGATITAVLDAYRRRDTRTLVTLARIRELAVAMRDAIVAADLDSLGALVAEHWQSQRSLHPAIPTAAIDEVLAAGAHAGAIGGKALGASGGGCVLLVAAEDRHEPVRRAAAAHATLLPFTVDVGGFTVLEST